jgi:Protein of unknown function
MTSPTPRETDTKPPRPARPKRRRRGMGLWSLLSFVVVPLMAVILFVGMTGRPITAPDWLRDRVESRITTQIPGLSVGFGEMVLTVERGWRPSVRLRDVRFQDGSGVPIASVADLTASLAMRPLLEGQVQPKRITVTGVTANLRRGEDGRMTLSLGQNVAPARQASNMGQLIEQLDSILLQPALSALVSVDLRALTLRYEDVRSARAWTVDGGRLQLDRTNADLRLSGDFALLSGGAEAATLAVNYVSRIGDVEAQFGATITNIDAGDIAAQGPAFAWLDVLRAPISGALRGQVLPDGRLGPLNATLQIASGVVQPNDQTQPIPFDAARTYFTYDAASETIRFDELSVQSKWVTGRAEGVATLVGVRDGQLEEMVAQFDLSDLVANPAALYETPVAIDKARMDLRLRLDPFELTLGEAFVSDQGRSLRLWGDLAADQRGWQLALEGALDAVSPDRLLELWPRRVGNKTRTWLQDNLLAGDLSNIDLSLRATPGTRPLVHLNFEFDKADIRFVKTMPPIRDAAGHANILGNRFTLVADSGYVQADQGGRIDVAGTSFIVPDMTIKPGAPAVVKLQLSSTVTAALSMLDSDPLNVMTKAKLPATIADGRAKLQGTLALPLRKGLQPEEVQYNATGVVSSVRSTTLIPDRVLASDALNVVADNTSVSVSGPGRIGAVAFDGTWQQPIGAGPAAGSTFTGTVELSEQTIDEFNIGLPQGAVTGAGLATIRVGLIPDQPPTLDLRSTLQGIGLAIPQINWRKPPSQSGSFELAAVLGTKADVSRIAIDASGLSAAGRITLRDGGGMDSATFTNVKIDDWLDAPVVLTGKGVGSPPDIFLGGGSVDLRRADFGEPSGAESGDLSLTLDQLQINDAIRLTDFRGGFDTTRGMDGRFSGKVNGGTEVTGQLVPRNGRTAMRLTSTDAGGVFRSAGFLKQARDGELSLTLMPVGEAGTFDGSLRVTGIRIKDAPVMAELLNAMSVVGLLEQLGGQGIHFSEVDAQFRLTPSQIIVTSGSAVGPSMGLSLDGIYALDSNSMDMQGVITPIYLLNGIGSVLTRKGEGVFGFNYALSGNAQSPDVWVNPLSALTPGMFRNLFRKAPPVVEALDGSPAPNIATEQPAAPEPVEDDDPGR